MSQVYFWSEQPGLNARETRKIYDLCAKHGISTTEEDGTDIDPEVLEVILIDRDLLGSATRPKP